VFDQFHTAAVVENIDTSKKARLCCRRPYSEAVCFHDTFIVFYLQTSQTAARPDGLSLV
jgi:hypothetical protein